MKQIMEEMKLLKEQKKNNEELLKYIKIEEQSNNKSKYEYIKNQQALNEEKKRALEMEKQNKLKNDIEKRMMEEQRLREEAEKKLTDLEQEEIEIMKRIRTTTQVHKDMMENYEKIATTTVTEPFRHANTATSPIKISSGKNTATNFNHQNTVSFTSKPNGHISISGKKSK